MNPDRSDFFAMRLVLVTLFVAIPVGVAVTWMYYSQKPWFWEFILGPAALIPGTIMLWRSRRPLFRYLIPVYWLSVLILMSIASAFTGVLVFHDGP
jgi:hypothetical protein